MGIEEIKERLQEIKSMAEECDRLGTLLGLYCEALYLQEKLEKMEDEGYSPDN